MKTIIKEYKVYKFDELSDKGKDNAINKLSDINTNYQWWDSIYEDAENIGMRITGFDIYRNKHVKAEFTENALTVAAKIMKDHGKDCDTHKTAKYFMAEYKKLKKSEKEDFDNNHELAENFLYAIKEDYASTLQREYDYYTSSEAIIETIQANDYDFTEDGKLF